MTPRIWRIIAISCAVVVLLVVLAFLRNIQIGHRQVNTVGKIAFVSDRGSPGYTHIWTMNADGSDLRELTQGSENDVDPAFSPDGSQIAFASDRGGQPEIYLMDGDGVDQHAVTIGSDSKSDPEFSPDGTQLGFLTRGTLITLDTNGNQTTPQLPSPSSATSSATNVLSRVARFPVTRYSWQPSGTPKPQNGAVAALQESDSGDLQALTLLPKLGADPKILAGATNLSFGWSPDGSNLMVAALGIKGLPDGQSASGLLLFSPSGQAQPPPFPMGRDPNQGPQNPVYSPDGTQIAFEVWDQPDIAHRKILGIAIAPVNGSASPRVLVRGTATDLRWSPDGAHILYLAPQKADKNRNDIWVMDPDGSNRKNLTDGQGDNSEAIWSPALRERLVTRPSHGSNTDPEHPDERIGPKDQFLRPPMPAAASLRRVS